LLYFDEPLSKLNVGFPSLMYKPFIFISGNFYQLSVAIYGDMHTENT